MIFCHLHDMTVFSNPYYKYYRAYRFPYCRNSYTPKGGVAAARAPAEGRVAELPRRVQALSQRAEAGQRGAVEDLQTWL